MDVSAASLENAEAAFVLTKAMDTLLSLSPKPHEKIQMPSIMRPQDRFVRLFSLGVTEAEKLMSANDKDQSFEEDVGWRHRY